MPWPCHGHAMAMATAMATSMVMAKAMAMSLGPTSLYADKPSPKMTFFCISKKNRSVRTNQNDGSIAPRCLLFDPIAKETVSSKTQVLGGRAVAGEFPVPAVPHPITQGYHIPFGCSPSLRLDVEMFGKTRIVWKGCQILTSRRASDWLCVAPIIR